MWAGEGGPGIRSWRGRSWTTLIREGSVARTGYLLEGGVPRARGDLGERRRKPLAERRMGVDRAEHILGTRDHLDRQRSLGDQLGGMRSDGVDANDPVGRAVDHRADEAGAD